MLQASAFSFVQPGQSHIYSRTILSAVCLIDCYAFVCWLSVFIFHAFDWDSCPFPNPLLGGWFVSRRLLLSQLHFYVVAPKSRSSFVANIRYIVYDCSSSIGQHCAGCIFAISNIGHHSAIVPLLALYRRLFCHSILTCILLFYYDFIATIVLTHSSLLTVTARMARRHRSLQGPSPCHTISHRCLSLVSFRSLTLVAALTNLTTSSKVALCIRLCISEVQSLEVAHTWCHQPLRAHIRLFWDVTHDITTHRICPSHTSSKRVESRCLCQP